MPDNETTTRFSVDISELKKAMQEAKRQVAVANSEFKAASSSMDDWTKSSEGINAKLTQLSSNLKSQKTILSSLEAQYEAVVREQGEGSKAADDLKIKINNQRAVVNNTEKEISKYNDALTEVAKAEKTAAKTGQTVAEVLEDMGNEAKDAEDGFTVLKGTIATFAGNVLSNLVGSLKDAAGSFLSLGESTREQRDQMSKLESASEDAGYSVDYAKDKYKDLYGVLADETATNTAISNFMAMGAEEKTLNSLLDSSVGIWAKFGDSIPLDGLAEAINHTSQLGSVQGNLADALEWSGVNVDDFNAQLEKCSTEQERQELIADTLNGLYGDLSASYQENNKDIIEANKANANYTDTMAKLGAKVEPITTTLREGFTKLLEKILELTEDVDFSGFTAAAEKAFAILTDKVLPAVVDGLGWIIDNKDTLIAGIVGIGTAFAVFKVVSLITAVTTALKGMSVAQMLVTAKQWLLNTALLSNPIALVVAAIAGLVAAFVVLWNKCDGFREFFINLWENLKNAVQVGIDFIVNLFNMIVNFFKENWQGILLFIVNPFAGAFKLLYDNLDGFRDFVDNKVIKPVATFFSDLWSNIKNGASNAWTGIKSVFSKVGSFFKDTFFNAWTAVKNIFSTGGKIFDGIKDGIVSAFKTIVNSIIKGINKVVSIPFEGINKALKKLKGIKIAKLKPFDWISTISIPEIPLLAKGGLARRATNAIIGEAGKEAILPLENNTGWMRKLAADLVKEMGLESIYSVRSNTSNTVINNNYNQTINSPKQLSRLDIYRQSKNLLGYTGGA